MTQRFAAGRLEQFGFEGATWATSVAFLTSNIHNDEAGLGAGVFAGDGLQVDRGDDACAAAFHLLKIDSAADIAQEDEDFKRFDVRAGGERCSNLFGFDHTRGFAIHEEEIIARAGREGGFSQGDATTGGEIDGFEILNDPPARRELGVDLLAGALFRGFRHRMRKQPWGGVRPIAWGDGIAVSDSPGERIPGGAIFSCESEPSAERQPPRPGRDTAQKCRLANSRPEPDLEHIK